MNLTDVSKIRVMNNYVLIKHIKDSIDEGKSSIKLVLNNSHRVREGSIGKVIKVNEIIPGLYGEETVVDKELLEDSYILYHKLGIVTDKLGPNEEYKIIRYEDIIGILDEYKEE